MAKKVLYLGNEKWCWTESCQRHAAVIAAKTAFLKARESSDPSELIKATVDLRSTPEGLSTYNYLQVQEMTSQMGRKVVVGLDLDGTTGDFTHGLRTYMATGLKLSQDQWLSHFPDPDEYAMWTGTNAWYTDKADFLSQFQAAEAAGIYRDIKPYNNSSAVLKELKAYGFDIKVITARGAEFNEDTKSWIRTHNIPVKVVLNPGTEKQKVKGIDVYIDDAPHVINTLLAHEKNVVVMEQSYNLKNIPEHENARRVDKWDENVVNAIFDLINKNKKSNK